MKVAAGRPRGHAATDETCANTDPKQDGTDVPQEPALHSPQGFRRFMREQRAGEWRGVVGWEIDRFRQSGLTNEFDQHRMVPGQIELHQIANT